MKGDLEVKQDMLEALKLVAPGTLLREGLDNIVRAKTGALIVASDSDDVMGIVDGGFSINSDFIPSNVYELAKMDGAIVLSEDLKKILYANAQLVPDAGITSRETGTRHRTAERVARQTGKLVISISQRRNVITLYKGSKKYVLKDVNEILNKANQAIQTLEKYKVVLDQAVDKLSVLEFENLVTVFDVTKVIQRNEMLMRVVKEIDKYILELGDEGRLIQMQLEELKGDSEIDGVNIVRDYSVEFESDDDVEYKKAYEKVKKLSSDEILDLENISKILGYGDGIDALDERAMPRGYRILSKIPRLPFSVLENTIDMFGTLEGILDASIDELDAVEGIGEVRAKAIKDSLRRFQKYTILDRHI